MTKPSPDSLANTVGTELTTYLGNGQVNPVPLAEAALFDRYEITDFDRLKAIHFLLYPDVVEFFDRLPDRLRHLKTVTETASNVTEGEIRGAINWSATARERAKRGFDDPTVFVTEAPDPVADIPENRVLRSFLELVKDDLTVLSEYDTSWVSTDQERAIRHAVTALDRHIVLADLSAGQARQVSDRELNVARQSRHDIYSEAARLYRLFEALQRNAYDEAAVQDILASTVIQPSESHRLYELSCVFSLVRLLTRQFTTGTLERVEPGSDTVARFAIPRDPHPEVVRVFWDQSGPYSFGDSVPNEDAASALPPEFQRFIKAKTEGEERVEALEGTSSTPMLHHGRPDLVVERRPADTTDPVELLIGEFKYSDRPSQLRAGIRELSEYLRFVRQGETYYYESDSVDVSGLVCTEVSETKQAQSQNVVHCSSAAFEQAIDGTDTFRPHLECESVRELVAALVD
jgi:hypothetical protein